MKFIWKFACLAALAVPSLLFSADSLWKVDDFDSGTPATGTGWFVGCDNNNLGTSIAPNPFAPEKGGSPKSPQACARIHGRFGSNQAPWPWAQLSLALDPSQGPRDMTSYKAIQFYAKGDGKTYRVILQKDSIKDYGDYQFIFTATKEWTLIQVPFADFAQPDWGKSVAKIFNDVTILKFTPAVNDAPFDLSIDDLAFLRDPTQKAPKPTTAAIQEIPLKELAAKKIRYTTVPLSVAGNRNFKDDPSGEGAGWTGQGKNSLYDMPTGKQVFQGIPFEISSTPHQQCVIVRGQGNETYPTKVEIPVKAKGKALYFLHAAAWGSPRVGTYTLSYEDGTSAEIPLRNNIEVFDWWTAGTSPVARIGWTGGNPKKDPVGLTLFAWPNPNPEKTISKITAQTPGDESFLMLVGLTLSDEGPYLVKLEPKVYRTDNWFAYEGVKVKDRKGTALDMSYLLDAPAGKHGWVKRDGENFVFEDGTPARFWGINIVASGNFPTHQQAEWMAETLSQIGVNMTRHHHMDAPWTNRNIFGNKDDTLSLDAESMDRFDYLVAQLQKRGIYQYFDLIVNRKPMASDGVKDPDAVPNGYKIEGEFDATLIKLQEKFIKQFLGHKNPYTGKTYAQDPAVCLMEIINEDSLFYRTGNEGEFGLRSKYYQDEWNDLYNKWLLKLTKSRLKLTERWKPGAGEKDKKGLQPGEDPQKGTVACIGSWSGGASDPYSRRRVLDTFRFYYDLQTGYYMRIRDFVRALKSRALITGSNHWVEYPIDLYANAQLDYIDRHNYWAHPSGGYGYSKDISFDPTSMLKNSKGGIIQSLAERRVKGLPYIITEWQASAPNDYRHEGTLLMGAYCDLFNWNALQFAFTHSDSFDGPLDNNFNIDKQPGMLGIWPATALLFHRRDVKEAGEGVYLPLTDAEVFDPKTEVEFPLGLGLFTKTGLEFTGMNKKAVDFEPLLKEQFKNKTATSVTGEVAFNYGEGVFRINAPRTQGFSGFSKEKAQAFKNLEVTLQNDYGAVIASSLQEKPLSQSGRILVSAIGNAINQGMETEPAGNRLKQVGGLPILVEPLVGKVKLANLEGDLSKAVVYYLNPSGKRMGKVSLEKKGQTLSFDMKSEYKSMHYEVVR